MLRSYSKYFLLQLDDIISNSLLINPLPRLDRKIEFPAPTEEARARIMQIHARKMNVDPDVNYEELARFLTFNDTSRTR